MGVDRGKKIPGTMSLLVAELPLLEMAIILKQITRNAT